MKKHTKLVKPAPLKLQREQVRTLATGDLLDVAGGMTTNSKGGVPGCHIPLSCGDC